MENILEVRNLKTVFNVENGTKEILKGINFQVKKGKITCIVGQSGSGKSTTAMSIIKMLPQNAFIKEGSILFKDIDLVKADDKKMEEIRGSHIFSIFQNAMNCFNSSLTMKHQIFDLISSNIEISKCDFENKICLILKSLNFDNPLSILNQYPFQLSGGMLQRMSIASAILMKPEIIIADEPTTALDVTTQKEILKQLKFIQNKFDITILLITHDFGVVAEMADEVIVMKDGIIAEQGNVFDIFNNPQNNYTSALIKATFDREVVSLC